MIKRLFNALAFTAAIALMPAASLAKFNKSPAKVGAMESGKYRSLFSEVGKSQEEIDKHVMAAFDKMFAGTEDERLYYEYDEDEAYLKAIDSNDIRSEGISWGMTITVMLNKKSEFDKLWRFAHDRMKNTSGEIKGTFGWHVRVHPDKKIEVLDTGPAPDGELYMAFALFNAAARWGNGEGVLDYQTHADEMLDTLKNILMDPGSTHILFSPHAPGFTDPSYHIPAFYDYFAKMASRENKYWAGAAASSRKFLKTHFTHTKHGLATYLANFDGSPLSEYPPYLGNPGDVYEGDAWRVAMNVGIDAHLSGVKKWHSKANNKLQHFFKNKEGFNQGGTCDGGYSQKYHIDGKSYGECNKNNWSRGAGQIATNAVASLAATNRKNATAFIEMFWNNPWPTGKYRYYHGALHMLGMLHASGKFKVYEP